MNKPETLKFSVQKNSVDLLFEDEDISILSIDLLHQDETDLDCNRNKCSISHRAILSSLTSFKNKPIIFIYNSVNKDNVTDVKEHAQNDEDIFNTRIGGHIPPDSKIEFVKRDNGKTYCNCQAILQKRYVPQLMDILKNNNNKLEVSIEINAYGNENKDTGIFVINKFKLLAVTILSPTVMAGIEGSHLDVIKFSQIPKEDIEKMNKRFVEFSNKKQQISKTEKGGKPMEDNNIEKDKPQDNNGTIVFAKEDYGKGENHKVNKSKDAMSTEEWGNVDKTELRKKALEEPNYKEKVKDIYLVVLDDFESKPSEALKYPVMQLKDGEWVYNRYGLSSALGYAKAEKDDAVVAKAEKIYKDLGLEDDDKKEKEDVKNSLEIKCDIEEPNKEEIVEEPKQEEPCAVITGESTIEINTECTNECNNETQPILDNWKEKYEALEKEYATLQEENKCMSEKLCAYKMEEDKVYMKDYLNTYKRCFNTEEMQDFTCKIETYKKEDFEKEVDNQVKEYAKKMSIEEPKEKEEQVNNSFRTFGITKEEQIKDIKTLTLADIIKQYSK